MIIYINSIKYYKKEVLKMQTTTEQKTCQQRISEKLRDRLDGIKEAMESEDKREELDQSILSVEKSIVYEVLFSWGGPADFFKIYVNPKEREIDRITYHFQDWFEGAERNLTGKDFDLVADYFSYLADEV